MRKMLTLLGTLLAAFMLLFATASVASASADGPELCNANYASCGWFTNNGDVIHVNDGACDNRAAAVQVYAPDAGIADNIFNHAGCGTTVQYSYGTSMPENITVYYRPCIGDANGNLDESTCTSGWTHGTS